jgi:cation diffusion facilitator CzcD-associated flavoprotein CzcO
MFKTKHEVRDYMNRYAQNKGLAQCMSFGETVLRISHEPEVDKDRPWRVATDKRELRARRVVVATGLNRQPHIPHIPGSEERAARGARALRHSWSVSSCDEYKGERVLLVLPHAHIGLDECLQCVRGSAQLGAVLIAI